MTHPRIHLICNAHLDPVWQWRWEEGCAETISTFRAAVELLHEYPDFIFNHNEAVLYQWILKYDPDLFAEIQKLVKVGRWCISGGWYLQPDVNLPGTESIIRHIAEGRRFFKEHFGVQPIVAYNFDSFGHSGGLPQLLKQAGYKMYIHLRPQSSELELPSDLYRWRGVDGSEILGYRIAVGLYHTEYDNLEQRLIEGVELALKLNRDVPVFWGIGDHGGGATRADLEKIKQFQASEKRVEVIHSTPERFYEAVRDPAQNAPLVEGDLQRIFTGCYTSLSRIKRGAQKSLHRLVQAETLRAATWWLYGQEYPQSELMAAWQDHLFNDFHDILPGSCTEPAERDALDWYGRVAETARRLRLGAAITFNNGSPKSTVLSTPSLNHQTCSTNLTQSTHLTTQPIIPLTIMNTNPGLTHVPIEVECMLSHRPKWSGVWHLKLFNLNETELPCQEEQPEALLPFNGWRRKVSFMADLPGVGATHFYLLPVEGEPPTSSAIPMLKFQIDATSGLIKELNGSDSKNCLAGPLMQPLVVEDTGDSWGTDCWAYRHVIGRFELEPGSFRIVETGPIRTIYQSVLTFNHSRVVMNTIAYADFPVIEYRLRIHWNEERRRLKLSIPTVFKSDKLIGEVPGGIISRPADGEEHVHGRWLMIESGQDTALGVVNSGQHGLDFKDGELRLSVLRSAAYCHERGFHLDPYPARKFMDQGVHEVRLLVTVGSPEAVRRSLPGLAAWLNGPPFALAHLPICPLLPDHEVASGVTAQTLLSLSPDHVSLLACKKSWDGNALILRLQESAGIASHTTIKLTQPEVQINLAFRPLEIKTVRVEASGRWAEVDLIDEI
ncbi:MAG: hypothetical protein ONB37_14125 [candidate division KSB1 bacterium]|nr:hypothetical protein [candidate division KSB1 bacterium]